VDWTATRYVVLAENILGFLTASSISAPMGTASKINDLQHMVYENAQGGTTTEYDKPSTQLSPFQSAQSDVQGRSLDDRLAKLCDSVLQQTHPDELIRLGIFFVPRSPSNVAYGLSVRGEGMPNLLNSLAR
jgi:hypothetical protein